MRPFPGDDAPPALLGRPRAAVSGSSFDNDTQSTMFNLPPSPQMTYFLASESEIDAAQQESNTSSAAIPIPSFLQRPKDINHKGGGGLSHHQRSRSRELILDNNKDGTGSSSAGGGGVKGPIETLKHEESIGKSRQQQQQQQPPPLLRPVTPPPRNSNLSSQPVTPTFLTTVVGGGALSGPASNCSVSVVSSRRNSFNGSTISDTFLGESCAPSVTDMGNTDTEEAEVGRGGDKEAVVSDNMMDSGNTVGSSNSAPPQLIMPSIKMPSRRPFTEAGKRLGRLKVVISGDSGVGKTSLIKAMVQSCEHIVHVDPIAPFSPHSSLQYSRPNIRHSKSGSSTRTRRASDMVTGTREITEIYASTKPYPEWWSEMSDMDGLGALNRRKSPGDTVLDRNICFVDTPGYGSGSSSMDTITPVAEYIESHLQRMGNNTLSDGDILNLLGGEGGVQVDVVFYVVSNRLRPVDIEYLQRLAPLTNIILLLAQADLMSPEQVTASKEQISGQLKEANIRPFSFVTTATPAAALRGNQGLYAISSATGSDYDTMDASLLMSPDYVQPLFPTELATLVEQMFSPDGSSWLRHSAARKYVQWRKSDANPSRPMSLYHPLSASSIAGSGIFSPAQQSPSRTGGSSRNGQVLASSPMGLPPSSYALARITDHVDREERLAQVRLANWAADLQKSMANERAQYEALARGERAIWLTERLNECVKDGTLVPLSGGSGGDRDIARMRERIERKLRRGGMVTTGDGDNQKRSSATRKAQRHQDPLGLLEVAADLRHKGLIALELIGGLGVLGGLVMWIMSGRNEHGHLSQAYEWAVTEWDKFWYGVR
ncbi:hypothetical protein QBC46DRAFT_309388 [Diplogelasinospora grovesii]|uniref:Septin-type G domain-containing protein n=1 Tax=Diplogelasinospora grovesii TaxID=303347 RepID=A0AAN6NC09_9PEZI|nr:hypothetical protein QBC46DRAFT_309388 [Diplogelasinospora grovesii]